MTTPYFVKAGNNYINLSLVTHVEPSYTEKHIGSGYSNDPDVPAPEAYIETLTGLTVYLAVPVANDPDSSQAFLFIRAEDATALLDALEAATNADHLSPLKDAVDALRQATPRTQRFTAALGVTMDALDALFPEPKDDTP